MSNAAIESLGKGIKSSEKNIDFKTLYQNNKHNYSPVSEDALLKAFKFNRTAKILLALPVMTVIGGLATLLYIQNFIPNLFRDKKDKIPVFYKQKRVGYEGKLFEITKFCTLDPIKSAQYTNTSSNTSKDPRIHSWLAHKLRDTGLDELSQFTNVLRGEMFLIGVRPHPIGYANEYQDIDNNYVGRFRVMPGIIGPQKMTFLMMPIIMLIQYH